VSWLLAIRWIGRLDPGRIDPGVAWLLAIDSRAAWLLAIDSGAAWLLAIRRRAWMDSGWTRRSGAWRSIPTKSSWVDRIESSRADGRGAGWRRSRRSIQNPNCFRQVGGVLLYIFLFWGLSENRLVHIYAIRFRSVGSRLTLVSSNLLLTAVVYRYRCLPCIS
jgi:hypothetical protein